MAKEKKEAVLKIRQIPPHRIDLDFRMKKNPERDARNKKIAISLVIVILVLAVLGAGVSAILIKRIQLQDSVNELQSYLDNPTNMAQYQEACLKEAEVKEKTGKTSDLQNIRENLSSYPDVGSEVFQTLQDNADQLMDITITGYDSSSGKLNFDATAKDVSNIASAIAHLKELSIFQDVTYTGYSAIGTGDVGYRVNMECTLSEIAGKGEDK